VCRKTSGVNTRTAEYRGLYGRILDAVGTLDARRGPVAADEQLTAGIRSGWRRALR
jgi:hypothetical protein